MQIQRFKIILSFLFMQAYFVKYFTAKSNFGIHLSFVNFTGFRDDYVDNFSCNFHNIGNKVLINVEFTPLQNFSNGLKLNAVLDVLRKDNTKLNIINVTVEMCQMLNIFQSSPLLKIITKGIRHSTNFPHHCPLRAYHKLVVKNFTLRPEDYPLFILPMNFMWYLHMRKEQSYYGYVLARGRVFKI